MSTQMRKPYGVSKKVSVLISNYFKMQEKRCGGGGGVKILRRDNPQTLEKESIPQTPLKKTAIHKSFCDQFR